MFENNYDKNKKKIEKIKKFYEELNKNPEKLKTYFKGKIIQILAEQETSSYHILKKYKEKVTHENMFIIDDIITEYKKLNYINDDRYLSMILKSYSNKYYGEKKIFQKLKEIGFKEKEIKIAIDESQIDFYEVCKEYKIKKYGENKITDIKLKQKAYNHILSKGFSFDQLNYAFL